MTKQQCSLTPDKSNDKLQRDALRFFEQGHFTQAIHCFKQLDPQATNPEIQKQIQACLRKLARKLWRQDKPQEFAKVMTELNAENQLGLAYARLQGPEALLQLANAGQGDFSTLAFCSTQSDVKSALIRLRQLPEKKLIAEGWLSLLKGDFERAMDSFTKAEETTPSQAKIGKGITHLCMGNFSQAQQALEPLRPFATRRFPVLTKSMKWDQPEELDKLQLPNILFKFSLSELQQAEKLLLPHQKMLHAWIHLKIGDELVLQGKQEGLSHWSKAERAYPALKFDVLKRRYVAAYRKNIPLDFTKSFLEFYQALHKHYPLQAFNFIEYLVFDSNSIHALLNPHILKDKSNKWMISPPPLEWKLLWLHLTYYHSLFHLNQVIFFTDRGPDELCGLDLKEWRQLFVELDLPYLKRESYLRYKLTLGKIMNSADIIRESVFKLLHLNPHLKEELIPLYTKETLKLLQLSRYKNSSHLQKEIHQEVTTLRELFPSDFDLTRLAILSDPSELSVQAKLEKFVIHLSAPLFAVLKLQLAIDQGEGLARCRKLIPPSTLYHRSREADGRLFSALSTKRLNFPKKELQQLLDLLAPDVEIKHEFFTKMSHYEEANPPLSLIKQWMKQDSKHWQPHYHLALYYKQIDENIKSLDTLLSLFSLIPKNAPEFTAVLKTLEFYEPPEPYSFLQEEVDDVEELNFLKKIQKLLR